MDFLNDLQDNTLIITPSNMKNKILKKISEEKKLINFKILTKEEFKKKYLFDYDTSAVLYLMDKYNYCYEVSQTLIENMYYINQNTNNAKINNLLKLKQELLDNNLLIIDPYFKKHIKTWHIIIAYPYLDKFDKAILSNLSYNIVNSKYQKNKIPIYEFSTLEEELSFVFEQIIDLLSSKKDINKIKIANVNEEYITTLKRLSELYNIPINIKKEDKMISNILVQEFLNNYKNTHDLVSSISSLSVKGNETYEKIVNTCNKYININYSPKLIYQALIHDFSSTNIKTPTYKNAIDIIDFNNYIKEEDEYIFFISFNQKYVLTPFKDEDYFNDKEKKLLNLSTSYELNTLIKESFLNKINDTNIILTYKLINKQEEYFPSILIEDLDIDKRKKPNKKYTYSKTYDSINCAIMMDNMIKYGTINPLLNKYYSTYNIPYHTYNNAYTKINYEPKKLTLSYSSIDNYYKCSFKYYLDYILEVSDFNQTFNTFVGSLYHFVLSNCFNKDFDFDTSWNTYLKDKSLKANEQFFLIKLKEELKQLITFIKQFYDTTEYKKLLLEKEINLSYEDYTFKGIIDKVMIKDNNAAIIDYKTGSPNLDLTNMIHGINMQLGIYVYLLKRSTFLENVKITGIYYQKILPSLFNKKINITYDEQRQDNLKLLGYSNIDSNIKEFDPTMNNSIYIKGMKQTDKGYSANAKLISDEKIESLDSLIDNRINEAKDNIKKASFDINPKRISDKLISCEYCNYKDICYRKEKDIIDLQSKDILSIKEGD